MAARAAASSSTFARAPVPGGIFVEVGATFFSCAVPDRIEAIKSSRSPPPAGARTGTDGLLAWGGGGAGGSGGAGGGGGAAMGGGGGGGGGGAPPPTIGGGSGGGGGAPTPMAGGCGGASGTDEGPGMGGGTGGWPTSGGGDGRLAGGAVAGRGGAGGGDGGRASTTGGGAMRDTGGGGMPGTGGGRCRVGSARLRNERHALASMPGKGTRGGDAESVPEAESMPVRATSRRVHELGSSYECRTADCVPNVPHFGPDIEI